MIALVTASQTDPVWFFKDLPAGETHNFMGPVGAFAALVSMQLFGVTSYLLPGCLAFVAWHYFWCTSIKAVYTKSTGAVLLISSFAGLCTLAVGVFAGQHATTA